MVWRADDVKKLAAGHCLAASDEDKLAGAQVVTDLKVGSLAQGVSMSMSLQPLRGNSEVKGADMLAGSQAVRDVEVVAFY